MNHGFIKLDGFSETQLFSLYVIDAKIWSQASESQNQTELNELMVPNSF